MPLDPYDEKILKTLAEDGRISWRDLADAIGLSATPTLRRVRRLEDEGYILGYGARLDEAKLGRRHQRVRLRDPKCTDRGRHPAL